MNFQEFIDSLQKDQPTTKERHLLALWYDAKNNWTKAHDLVDGGNSLIDDRIHAYLHRKEGDQWNANYWYKRAGEKMSVLSLEEEWELLVRRYTS
jgi:hypothetical protein